MRPAPVLQPMTRAIGAPSYETKPLYETGNLQQQLHCKKLLMCYVLAYTNMYSEFLTKLDCIFLIRMSHNMSMSEAMSQEQDV